MNRIIFFLLIIMCACESTDSVLKDFEVEQNSAILNQRIEMINERIDVITFKSTSVSERVVSDEVVMSLTPEMDCTNCTRIIDADLNMTLTVDAGEVVGVLPGVVVDGGIRMEGGTLVVCGTINTGGVYGAGGTIIINSSGVINSSNFFIDADLIVANYGKHIFPAGKGLTLKGQYENYTSLSVERISMNIGSNLYNGGELQVVKDIAQSGQLINRGTIVLGNNYYLNSSGVLNNFCRVEVAQKISFSGRLLNASYISCGSTFYVNSHKGFLIKAASLMEVKSIIINDDISNNDEQLGVIFYSSKKYHNTGVVDENVLITNNAEDAYIPASSCHSGFGKEPVFYLIAELNPPVYDGVNLSATSVQVLDGYAYVSYHMNGENYGAAIDVIDVSLVNDLSLVQQFSANNCDFNECKLGEVKQDGTNNLWAIGAQQEGSVDYKLKSPAAIFKLKLKDGLIVGDGAYEIVDLAGSSGNAISITEEVLLAVSGSEGGISVIDQSNFQLLETTRLPHAKYLANYGEQVFCLTTSESNAHLTRYNYGDYTTAIETFEFDPIYPIDGKLVLYLDDDKAYVASGNQGLNVFTIDALLEKTTYNSSGGFVNGVSADEQLVYLANGTKGLVILNKQTMTPVGAYNFEGSANFVTTQENGLIFLANGKGGLKILYREQ